MPSSNPANDDDDVSPEPATPRKSSDGKKGSDAPKTPASSGKKASSGHAGAAAPNSAPAKAPQQRNRANSSKKPVEPPTLLADFFLGRPSQARLAAERQRRKSIDAVKAELRHEMRQSAVRRVQPPGGVKDRVKAWQKTNAKAMVEGHPDDAATEPTDVAFDGAELESVTEEDRIRIKMRQKRKNALKVKQQEQRQQEQEQEQEQKPSGDKDDDAPEKSNATADSEPAKPTPKKRVVSDEHWVKNRGRRSPSRRVSPKPRKASPPSNGGNPIPKDFLQKTATNPNVSKKIKAWAAKVEVPDTPPPRSYRSSKSRERSAKADDSEIEVQSDRTSAPSQATAKQSLRRRDPGAKSDDGIRIKPVRRKKFNDDGIRVSAVDTTGSDDGIRVRPMSMLSSEAATSQTASSVPTRRRSKTIPSNRRPKSVSDAIEVSVDSELSASTEETKTEEPDNVIHVRVDPESDPETPTRRRVSKSRQKPRQRPASYQPEPKRRTRDDSSWIEDNASDVRGSQVLGSDLASSVANKSVADLPGEIPWGNSAFSELDLPLNGVARSRPKRTKVDRSSSLKGMGVFKKVVEEGKKIMHEINEPPKQPAENKPPSIEKWLNNTVDPFVDKAPNTATTTATTTDTASRTAVMEPSKKSTPEPKKSSTLEPPKDSSPESSSPREAKVRRRSSHETRTSRSSQTKESTIVDESDVTPSKTSRASPKTTPGPSAKAEGVGKPTTPTTPTSNGLKRSKATRNTSSPVKPTAKRPFLGFLKEAFQGESGGFVKPPVSYQSQEERFGERYGDEYDDYTDFGSSYITDEARTNSELSSADRSDSVPPKMAGPRFRPPTNGNHELSTIMSEEDSSVIESDLTSDLSHSTLTQSTVLTKDSNLSRTKSKEGAPSLKRRLTKHSDLVSVLSLPDGDNVPNTFTNSRSRPSLRKAQRGSPGEVTSDELLREFADDEGLYSRELKTLVDGVVPVLLSQVMNTNNPAELFGANPTGQKTDTLSKSVVNMGVALEKLRAAHKKAPQTDLRKLAHWAHGVVPIYNSYLNSWRLGFQDLVVNLAPVSGIPDDEDSLLNAMPRNENGDIINAEGQRVDVAHLLKRPLIRVKQLAKFMKCVDSMISSEDTSELLKNFDELHEKARRRHREETARLTDEDAINTDATRSRDIMTLDAIDSVTVHPQRQVSAKDTFSLDLAHSNGQRLECRVEMIHRDNPKLHDDTGDLLIRVTEDGHRPYLLFPPLAIPSISARTGEGNLDMVVMIRGCYRGKQWHELLTLESDSEDQILDWLDILPVTPVPPREPEPSVIGDPDDEAAPEARLPDVPVGVSGIQRKLSKSRSAEPSSPTTPTKRPPPARYHPRASPLPTTPPSIPEEGVSLDRTPTQDDFRRYTYEADRSRPLDESMRPNPLKLMKKSPSTRSYRDDGAPPPPVHRTLSPIPQSEVSDAEPSTPTINPPTEPASSSKVKRRTSSPLKHEYLPSDGSSASGHSVTGESVSGSDTEDSDDDEIESVDIPETEIGVSLKSKPVPPAMPAPIESVVDSECSLTPSNSASQAGLHGHKTAPDEPAVRYMATISRWSDKGMWKDILGAPCSIIVTPGMIEAYPFRSDNEGVDEKPLLALDLTPLVLIRQSTAVDLEIRSSTQPHCLLAPTFGGGNFRFRCNNGPECYNFYMSVHQARLNNQKFIKLENEARFKSFGERDTPAEGDGDGDTSSRRRSWFGRKNSYRGSTRAPSQSHDGASTTPSSSVSATSFLKRLTVAGNLSFNIARSSVDKQSRPGSIRNSLYTSGSSSASGTPPRSPSISVENSGRTSLALNSDNIRIRLHLLVSATKWEDYGNCTLQVRRPPPGWHQALRADHGLEKRVTVTTLPKKDSEKPKIALDAVLGSGCFTPMGSRGIVCGVWEEVKDADGVVGMVPATGATGGNIKKWCFQCASVPEAGWVLRLLHQEVLRA